MGIVRGFQNDIFLSYSSDNNRDVTYSSSTPTGWVDRFTVDLQGKLNAKKLSPTLWVDKTGIQRGKAFETPLAKAVGSSAIFVALISKSYLYTSQYCKKEFGGFWAQGESLWPFKVADYPRRVIVTLEDMTGDDSQITLATTPPQADAMTYRQLAIPFYAKLDGVSTRFRRNHPTEPEYDDRLEELATLVNNILEEMIANAPLATDVIKNTADRCSASQQVYICNVREPMLQTIDERDGGTRAMIENGPAERLGTALAQEDTICVLDPILAGTTSPREFLDVTATALQRAKLCVHVVDFDAAVGLRPAVFDVLQKTVAQAGEAANIRRLNSPDLPLIRLIWISDRTWNPSPSIPDEQIQFLEFLKNQESETNGVWVRKGDESCLLKESKTALGCVARSWEREARLSSAYISYQAKNAAYAEQIEAQLIEMESIQFDDISKLEVVVSPPELKKDYDMMHAAKIRAYERMIVIYSGEDQGDKILLHKNYVERVRSIRQQKKSFMLKRSIIVEPNPPPITDPGIAARAWKIVPWNGNDPRSFEKELARDTD